MLSWLAVMVVAGGTIVGRAADAYQDAAAVAAQRGAEERLRRLEADIQSLQDTQEILLKRQEELRQRLDRLADDIRALKEDQGRSSGNFATREELRKFVEKLREVDQNREADKKLILDSIKELARLPAAPAPESKPAPRRPTEPSEEPYVYVVKQHDRLLEIIAEYNNHFQKQGQAKITLEQVLKANPGLNPNRLYPGKKIRIPVPPKADG